MQIVGEVALNIATILYTFFYLPQLIHNIRYKKYANLSMGFHALLLLAVTADLFYGFGRIGQWQYRFVSVVMFTCIMIQHIQLYSVVNRFRYGHFQLGLLTVIMVAMLSWLAISLYYQSMHKTLFVMMGWVTRIGYWFYVIPQFIKNRQLGHADAISPWFLLIAVVVAICDTISAWIFMWGPSSLYGAPMSILLQLLLLWQWYRLSYTRQKKG